MPRAASASEICADIATSPPCTAPPRMRVPPNIASNPPDPKNALKMSDIEPPAKPSKFGEKPPLRSPSCP